MNARNWSDFVLLTPNVTQDGGTGLVSFHGISGLYNQNYVDGANNNQMLFSEARGRASGAPYVYSVDSIKEFQAETSNYSVEFGQAAGGQVNAITKSGTNTMHGDLFYFLRYPTLNALDPLPSTTRCTTSATLPRCKAFLLTQPTHQQQQFGGSVGGPIIKDRLFYFFTYDGFRKVGKALYTDSNYISHLRGTSSRQLPRPTVHAPAAIPSTRRRAQPTITARRSAPPASTSWSTSPLLRRRAFAKEDLFFPRLDYHINSKNDAFVDFNFADFQSAYGYSRGGDIQQQLTFDQRPHLLPRAVPGGRMDHPNRQLQRERGSRAMGPRSGDRRRECFRPVSVAWAWTHSACRTRCRA